MKTTPKVTTTLNISLAKHQNENRTLMCWYTTKVDKVKIRFRSDAFVSEELENKLHHLHCTIGNSKVLLEKCAEILAPYAAAIEKEARAYLKLDVVKRLRNTNFNIF
jgi:hypothetical protein